MKRPYHILNGVRFNTRRRRHFFSGIDFGPRVELVATSDPAIMPHRAIFRARGHMAWWSRGERQYYPTQYFLAVVDWAENADDPGTRTAGRVVEVLAEAKPGTKWRALLNAWYEPLYCNGIEQARTRARRVSEAWQ